jgi:2-polyprenyl-6-methoxyphenol hydroxylase-like FAD-dependent oxidoreductase
MPDDRLETTCCIAGGGPAGIMLGVLLARAGVAVTVLERHADFLRDFRGDTIHPSTLEIMGELGLLDAFLARPHQKVRQVKALIGNEEVTFADFGWLGTRCKFVALMPQWDFLNFLAETGARYPQFRLIMQADVTGLVEADGRVAGLRAATPDGEIEIHADLVVGADGRHSTVRERAGFEVMDIGAPIDVLWMRLAKRDGDPDESGGRINYGGLLVTLDRGDYWQCAYVIPKGGFEAIRAAGLDAFRARLVRIAPFLSDRVGELAEWDDIKLLTVAVDRLKRWWRPGLICIGDAAHAMSPIGGVGVNLAVQDAVAAANILAAPLRARAVSTDDLDAVQRRRSLAMQVIQKMQVAMQGRIIGHVLGAETPTHAPLALRLFDRIPILRWIPAHLVGVGIRPEHVRIAEAPA